MRILRVAVVIVPILATAWVDLVQHNAQHARPHRPQLLEGLLYGGQFCDTRFDHQNDPIHSRCQGCGIRHCQQGRGVDQNQVKILAQSIEDLRHFLRGEQLSRVGRQGPGGDDPQARDGVELDRARQMLPRLDEQISQACAVEQSEFAMDVRPAKVGVDQHHFSFSLGKDHSHVGRDGGLSLLRRWTGNHDPVQRFVNSREGDVGAQRPEGFSRR